MLRPFDQMLVDGIFRPADEERPIDSEWAFQSSSLADDLRDFADVHRLPDKVDAALAHVIAKVRCVADVLDDIHRPDSTDTQGEGSPSPERWHQVLADADKAQESACGVASEFGRTATALAAELAVQRERARRVDRKITDIPKFLISDRRAPPC